MATNNKGNDASSGGGNKNNNGGNKTKGKHGKGKSASNKQQGGAPGSQSKDTSTYLPALRPYIFDCGQPGHADKMRISWKHYVSIVSQHLQSPDLGAELRTRTRIELKPPPYPADLIKAFEATKASNVAKYSKLQEVATRAYEEAVAKAKDGVLDATTELTLLDKASSYDDLIQKAKEKTFKFTDASLQDAHDSKLKLYNKALTELTHDRVRAYHILKGQCTNNLTTKLTASPDWKLIEQKADPLLLYNLIEKTVLSGTSEETFHLDTLFDFYANQFGKIRQKANQDLQSWYDEFNSIIDVGLALGAQFGATNPQVCSPIGKLLFNKTYDKLTADEKSQAVDETLERFLAIAFLNTCGNQYQPARDHYKRNFKAGDSTQQPPTSRQQVLSVLTQRWAPTAGGAMISSQGTAFYQHGGNSGKNKKKGKKGNNNSKSDDKGNNNNKSSISHIKYDPSSGMSKIDWD